MHIHLSGIHFRYQRDPVLEIPGLDINEGRVTALLGPNGAGKSTLLRVIAGLERPASGEVTIGGRPIRNARDASSLVAYGFQESVFLGGTIRKNLDVALRLRKLPAEERKSRIEDLARACDIVPLLDRKADHVSVGEGRRATLARTLALRAPVTLLDEPLAALDAPTRESLLSTLPRLLREYASTTVIVTHDRSEAVRLADDIVIIIGGRVRLVAPRQAAFSNPPDEETAAFLGYHMLDTEGGRQAIAPGVLQPGPGDVSFHFQVETVLRTPAGHEVLGAIDSTRLTVHLPLGAAIPAPGATITVSAPSSAILQFDSASTPAR